MLNYAEYNYGKRTSQDTDTVEEAIVSGRVKPVTPTITDLYAAAEWLALYACGEEDTEMAQSLANVVAFLDLTAKSKITRNTINDMKRKYAQENGLKFRQVKVVKK